jgi:hypothetical protein
MGHEQGQARAFCSWPICMIKARRPRSFSADYFSFLSFWRKATRKQRPSILNSEKGVAVSIMPTSSSAPGAAPSDALMDAGKAAAGKGEKDGSGTRI